MIRKLTVKELELNFGVIKFKLAPAEMTPVIDDILEEIRKGLKGLTADQRKTLRSIMLAPSGTLSVRGLFKDFERNTPEHETLRALRNAQFIRPDRGGKWSREKKIEIKGFGRMIWDKIGEERLLGPN